MIVHAPANAPSADPYRVDGGNPLSSTVTDYIGTSQYVLTGHEAPPLPQAFLVEKPAGAGTRIHFHDEDQFQIFVEGEGNVGPEKVTAPAVHFANFHTAYGPIEVGERGLKWLTVRDVSDAGAWFLPEGRAHADKAAQRRNISLNLAQTARDGLHEVIPCTDDGLGMWRLGLSHGEDIAADMLPPHPADSGGRFYVVLEGSLRRAGESLGKRSLVYATADEAVSLSAGDHGADVLIVQFPRDRRVRQASSLEAMSEVT